MTKIQITAQVSLEIEVDEDLKNEIRETLSLDDDKGPDDEDLKSWAADGANDELESFMADYGYSVDVVKVVISH